MSRQTAQLTKAQLQKTLRSGQVKLRSIGVDYGGDMGGHVPTTIYNLNFVPTTCCKPIATEKIPTYIHTETVKSKSCDRHPHSSTPAALQVEKKLWVAIVVVISSPPLLKPNWRPCSEVWGSTQSMGLPPPIGVTRPPPPSVVGPVRVTHASHPPPPPPTARRSSVLCPSKPLCLAMGPAAATH